MITVCYLACRQGCRKITLRRQAAARQYDRLEEWQQQIKNAFSGLTYQTASDVLAEWHIAQCQPQPTSVTN